MNLRHYNLKQTEIQVAKPSTSFGTPASELHKIYTQLRFACQKQDTQNRHWWHRANQTIAQKRNHIFLHILSRIYAQSTKNQIQEIQETIDNFMLLKREIIYYFEEITTFNESNGEKNIHVSDFTFKLCVELCPQAFVEYLWIKAKVMSPEALQLLCNKAIDSPATYRYVSNDPIFIYLTAPTVDELLAELDALTRTLADDFAHKRKLSTFSDTVFLAKTAKLLIEYKARKPIATTVLQEMKNAISARYNKMPCVYAVTATLLNKVIDQLLHFYENQHTFQELDKRYQKNSPDINIALNF